MGRLSAAHKHRRRRFVRDVMVSVMANMITAGLGAAVSAPFLLLLGTARRWWSVEHPVVAYLGAGALFVVVVSFVSVWGRSGIKSSDMVRCLLLATLMGVGVLAFWGCAELSGVWQGILGFIAFVVLGTSLFGLVGVVVSAATGEDFDDLFDGNPEHFNVTM